MKKILYLGPETQLVSFLRDGGYEVHLEQDRLTLEDFSNISPDLVVSYGYRYIIKEDIINEYDIINLHISYLPWNRGADPNFWSIYDETVRGVTIHFIDSGIDTGDIIFQKEVKFSDNERSLSTSYTRLKNEIEKLFIESWSKIESGQYERIPQNTNEGSHNYKKRLRKMWHLLPNRWETTREEIKCLKKELTLK